MSGWSRSPSAAGLLAGAGLDAVAGDPRRWHPVAGLGRLADGLERRGHRDHEATGIAYALILVGLPAAATRAVERALPPAGRALLLALATASALGGRSLRAEARGLAATLHDGDVSAARSRLPALCGRDPAGLEADELVLAGIESVAENTADAVVATLAWGAALGPTGVTVHRAANTLDAMVGHRTRRHRRFGWGAARLDDLLNLVPARMTALLTGALAPTVGGSPRDAWRIVRRDAAGHPSPNAGPVEAAMAGALGVTLGGGANRYGDHVDRRPPLGDGRAPTPADLDRAVALSTRVSRAALLLAVAAGLLRDRPRTDASREVAP